MDLQGPHIDRFIRMKMIVDNQIVKLFVSNPTKILNNPLLFNSDNHVSFKWPSLLEYLELGSILSNLPAFEQNQPLFEACISTLCANNETDVFFHLYDRLFAETLNQIKALPQLKSSFLLQALKEQRQKKSFLEAKVLLSPVLDAYETSLTEKASHTMHDLILYLAWERMCVCLSRLFDYQSTDPKFIKGIAVLRECLIESYQHIAQQGRTNPSIYRMLESFLFYQMREENLEKHTTAEWALLSQSFQALKAQDDLADFFYIDDAVILERDLKIEEENSECYLTLDPINKINARLSFAIYMLDKLKSEVPNWDYVLHQKKIVFLEP